MGSAGNDGVVDPQPHPDEGGPGERSFDPGLETGYLRRAPRDHELSPELGAAPFDPGPGHYDERRAQRAAKRGERKERRRQEAELKAEQAQVEARRFQRSHASQTAAAVQPIPQPEPELDP